MGRNEWTCLGCGAQVDERFDCCQCYAATSGPMKSEPGGIPALKEEGHMAPDENTQDTHESATAPVETAEVEPGQGREEAAGEDTQPDEASEA